MIKPKLISKKLLIKRNNDFLTPMYLKKLGLVYEAQKDYKSADDDYKKIKSDYSQSPQGSKH